MGACMFFRNSHHLPSAAPPIGRFSNTIFILSLDLTFFKIQYGTCHHICLESINQTLPGNNIDYPQKIKDPEN